MTDITAAYKGSEITLQAAKESMIIKDPQKIAELNERLKAFEDALKPMSEEAKREQLAKQMADPMSAVFRVGGKIVATIGTDTGVTFPSNGDARALGNAMRVAEDRGLRGEPLLDFLATELEAGLRDIYGAGLTVERYSDRTGPTSFEVSREMFGPSAYAGYSAPEPSASRTQPPEPPASRIAYDPGVLDLLNREGSEEA